MEVITGHVPTLFFYDEDDNLVEEYLFGKDPVPTAEEHLISRGFKKK